MALLKIRVLLFTTIKPMTAVMKGTIKSSTVYIEKGKEETLSVSHFLDLCKNIYVHALARLP